MTERADFLVELGTEELPPKALAALSRAFAANFRDGLNEARLSFHAIEPFATPRRLALRVRGLALGQPNEAVEQRGPPLNVAFDENGTPTRAAIAFAERAGVSVDAYTGPRLRVSPQRIGCRRSPPPPWTTCLSRSACDGDPATLSSCDPCTGW